MLPSPDLHADHAAAFRQWRDAYAWLTADWAKWRRDSAAPDAMQFAAELDDVYAALVRQSEALGRLASSLRAVGYGDEIKRVAISVAPGSMTLH